MALLLERCVILMFAFITVDFFVWQGEEPQEYHWYFKDFQRRQAEKDAVGIVKYQVTQSAKAAS